MGGTEVPPHPEERPQGASRRTHSLRPSPFETLGFAKLLRTRGDGWDLSSPLILRSAQRARLEGRFPAALRPSRRLASPSSSGRGGWVGLKFPPHPEERPRGASRRALSRRPPPFETLGFAKLLRRRGMGGTSFPLILRSARRARLEGRPSRRSLANRAVHGQSKRGATYGRVNAGLVFDLAMKWKFRKYG